MTRYATGRRLEYKARDRLIAKGFHVIRSAGSKGLFDLVAFNKDQIKFISVKKNTISNKELKKLRKIEINNGPFWVIRCHRPKPKKLPAWKSDKCNNKFQTKCRKCKYNFKYTSKELWIWRDRKWRIRRL